ncbi:HNH endonuclease [Candidatus Saccharibacteria bacterium]|nr:HNH endonuclease [Candidatus Saccharibacteria bacterium]
MEGNQTFEKVSRSRRPKFRWRRILALLALLGGIVFWLIENPASYEPETVYEAPSQTDSGDAPLATAILAQLEVKGRAPKTGYERTQFYDGWPNMEDGCSLRQKILRRDFGDSARLDGCNVVSGEYTEPYTGEHLIFTAREQISKGLQIDHIVALSDAWQKGAQNLEQAIRYQIATDPLNLVAVDSSANQKKSDGDAATWLPSNKAFRCEYVARQVSVKYKYHLWVTEAERDAIDKVLQNCPNQLAVGVSL